MVRKWRTAPPRQARELDVTQRFHRQSGGAVLTVVAIVLAAVIVVAGIFTPGYDQRYETVSRLGSPGQPLAPLVRTALVVFGIATVLAARETRRACARYLRWVGALMTAAGEATIVAGIAPKDPAGVPATAVSQLHIVAAITGVGALIVAMLVVAARSPNLAERQWSTAAVTVIVGLGTAFPFAWGTVMYGVLQKVILGTALVWLVATVRLSSSSS